jgi:pyruvate kinase
MKKRTKIVATLGPASSSAQVIGQLIAQGANVFRLNFSHGTHETHKELIGQIRKAATDQNTHVGILGDLCGPKIRVGTFPGGPVTLVPGQSFCLYEDPKRPGDIEGIGTSYPYLTKDLRPGSLVLLDDGNLTLKVTTVLADGVRCEVVDGGVLKDKKGMNMPNTALSVETITEKDRADLAFILREELDFVALSFVRRASDLAELRTLIGSHPIRIIAKIEKPEAMQELEGILDQTDGIMIARGDLGVEMPLEQIPALQRFILTRCSRRGIPVITATQMLESMIDNPRPTRAETTDVFNAILEGSDAVMLSGETAAGHHPVAAVAMMAAIAVEAEKICATTGKYGDLLPEVKREIEEIVAHSACEAAVNAGAKAIVAYTHSGNTAHFISKYHPPIPIVALTPREQACRRLTLTWGVEAVKVDDLRETDPMIRMVEQTFKSQGRARTGDVLVIVAGVPLGVKGSTNMVKLHRIS